MRNDEAYLEHIADGIDVIEEYLTGIDRQRFGDDRLRQDAVLRRLETLADAASHLSAGLKARHPEVDWGKVAGFRNVLAHGYLRIDLDVVWAVVTERLPELKAVVRAELKT